jgi:hypothetical protein
LDAGRLTCNFRTAADLMFAKTPICRWTLKSTDLIAGDVADHE